MSAARRSMVLMVVFVALWAAVEMLAGRLHGRYSAYQVVWSRYAVHLLAMLLVWGFRDPTSLWRTQRPIYQVFRSMLMLGMPASFVLSSQVGLDQGTVMSFFWLCPLMILVLARPLLGERAPALVWLLALVGFAGALLATSPKAQVHPALLIFPLGMGGTFALYVVMTRSLRTETVRANLFHTALGVFLALSPVMPRLWVSPDLHDVLVLTGVGLVGLAGLFVLDRLAAAAPVSASAPITYLQLPCTLALSWGLHDHRPGLRAALGVMTLVVVALCLFVREPLIVQSPV